MDLSSNINVKAKVNKLSNNEFIYLRDKFICTILLQLDIKKAAIANNDLSDAILLKQEWV